MKTRFTLILAVFVFCAGCSFGEEVDLRVEDAIPVDSGTVFVLDGTNEQQRAIVTHLMSKFPEMPTMKAKIEETERGKQMFGLFREVVSGDFKVAYTMNFEDLIMSQNQTPDYLLAAKIEKMEAFEGIVELGLEMAAEQPSLPFKEYSEKKVEYIDAEDFYYAKYRDVVIVATSEEQRATALKSLKAGKGFNIENEQYLELFADTANENISYGYIEDGENAKIYSNHWASNDGINTVQRFVAVEGARFLEEMFGARESIAKMYESIPGDGVVMYSESINSKPYINTYYQDLLDEEVEGDLVRDMANYFGITKDDLLEFIDSPSAFLMADTGQIYPSMGYFVQLEEEQVEAAKKIVGAMDGYLDELVEMLNVFMPPESGLKDAIKKDSVIVKGGVVKRIYLDWEGLSPEILEMLRSQNVVDISDLKIELFYGVTGDKKFVVALYPDFQNRYLRDGLDKNEEFMKGIEAYNLDEAYEVFYFDTAETMDIVDRIVGVMEESGGMRGDDAKIYEEVKAAIETIDYMSIYGEFTDGMVMREGLMKIGE